MNDDENFTLLDTKKELADNINKCLTNIKNNNHIIDKRESVKIRKVLLVEDEKDKELIALRFYTIKG